MDIKKKTPFLIELLVCFILVDLCSAKMELYSLIN